MDLVQKYRNAYKITYMGDKQCSGFKFTINPGESRVLTKDTFLVMINFMPSDFLDNVIYEECLLI